FIDAICISLFWDTPISHPSEKENPVERKNRDLKIQLFILTQDQHNDWMSKLPAIRFEMNSTPTIATSFLPAYITFGRELRTMDDVHHNLTEIVQNENFIPEITPYLLAIPNTLKQPQNGPVPEPVKLLRKRGRPPKKALLHGSGTDSCNSVSSRRGYCNTSTINLTRSGRRVRAPAFYE
ncbi:hypothetical protein ILUMI_14003, partial [Ignelater luminosus]